MGTIHFLLGFVTWVGGEARFPAPAYTPLLDLAGVAWPYGLLWMIGGTIMIVFKSDYRLVGIAIAVAVSNLWAALFALAAYNVSTAPLTPIVAYGGYGLLNALLFALIVTHRGRADEDG